MKIIRFFYRSYLWVYPFILLGIIGCQSESTVGDDCDPSKSDCTPVASLLTQKIKNVDILFVMDNSKSMEQEQDAIGNLINVLITGDRDGDGTPELDPAESLHLAVISPDMGLPGLDEDENPDTTGTCQGVGDDGLLLNEPDVSQQPSCSDRRFPRFLTYTAGVDDPAQTAQDYYCMLNIGIKGCGFEMPLEATLKALWPASDDSISFLNADGEPVATGHGDGENDGFLREDSLLAIVVVTDEDDCSAEDMDIFGLNYTGDRADLNVRCVNYPDKLHSIERYADNLKALRPNMEDRVIFAVIAGVPPRLVDKESDLPQNLLGYVNKNPEEVEAYYEAILDDADMEQIENKDTHNLVYSCEVFDDEDNWITAAFPPRRLVEVAREFGANGVVQSICDLGLDASLQTVSRAITNRMMEAAEKAEAAE